MRYSQAFIYTKREAGKEAEAVSHGLTIRAGLAHQVAAGHYDILPLGSKVLRKIEGIIREEMDRSGALEIQMPIMQPSTLWAESGRWEVYGEEMFKLEGRTKREFCLGPTHEELIVDMVRAHIQSYKDLPFTLYQFGTKFRDEKRPRAGLLRAKEFVMKDAYSFDASFEGLDKSYEAMRSAYLRILKRVNVHAIPTVAQTGEMGGNYSEEFMAPSPAGEDKFVVGEDGVARKFEDISSPVPENKVQAGIEICHIFKLGTKYSAAMNLNFAMPGKEKQPVVMGCYGIGVSRMLPTIIEQNHDGKGILWPREVAPFDVAVIPIRYDLPSVREPADRMYAQLMENGIDVLFDDRDISMGAKFKDNDLLGIPFKLIIGDRSIKEKTVELERRDNGSKEVLSLDRVVEEFSARR